jgi:hypothetical protein
MGSGVGPVLMITRPERGASSGDHAHVAVLRGLVTDYFQAISDPAFAVLDATEADWGPLDRSEGPWQDLRPSEALRLRALIGEAERRAVDRARQAIVEEVVAAGLAFVAEYPDAPLAGEAVAS